MREPGQMLANTHYTIILVNVALAVLWLVALYWVRRHLEPGIALYTTIILVFHFACTWNALAATCSPPSASTSSPRCS